MVKKWEGGFIWIPRPYKPIYKIEVDSTDVSDDILGFEFNYPVTETIGRFEIELDNSNAQYNTSWSGGETVNIYFDNDVGSATTLQFKGILELPKFESDKGYEKIILEGTHVSGTLLDITVTEEYTTATACSTILTEIIDTYASDFTYTNVETSSTTTKIKWDNKPFWACVVDLCTIAGFDCYVDNSSDFHFFEENSKEAILDAVVWNDNLLDNTGLGDSVEDVKNKVIIYGEDENGLPIVYETEDSASQTQYKIREKVIKDTSIDTYSEAQSRGDSELLLLKTPAFKGTVKSFVLPYMEGAGTAEHGGPGYKIWISIPTIQLQAQYKVTDLIHSLGDDYILTTELAIQTPSTLPKYFRQRLSSEIANETITNPNKMKFTYYNPFDNDDDITSHSQTETFGGVLRLATDPGTGDRYTTGTMITDSVTADSNVTVCDLRVSGRDIDNSQFYVSNDNGLSWEQIVVPDFETEHTFSSTGKQLKIKVELTSDTNFVTPEVSSLVCLYK